MYIYVCIANICIEGGRGSTDIQFDKVLSIRDEKVEPLLYCAWDYHSLHEVPSVFRRTIAPQKNMNYYLLTMMASLMTFQILNILKICAKYICESIYDISML